MHFVVSFFVRGGTREINLLNKLPFRKQITGSTTNIDDHEGEFRFLLLGQERERLCLLGGLAISQGPRSQQAS